MRRLLRSLPELPIILIVAALFFMLRQTVAPALAAGPRPAYDAWRGVAVLSSMVIFMLPGAMAVRLLRVGGSWAVRLPTYFVASLGLMSVPGLVVAIFNLNLAVLLWSFVGMSIILAVAAVTREALQPGEPDGECEGRRDAGEPLNRWLLGLTVIAIVAATGISLNAPMGGDDMNTLAFIQDDLVVAHISEQEPIHGAGIPPNSRGDFTTWPLNVTVMTAISGLPAPDFYELMRTGLVWLALAGFYTLVMRLFGRRNLALFSLIGFIIAVSILTTELDLIGFGLFARIGQDKFIVRFVILPLAMAWPVGFITRPRLHTYILASLVLFASAATHTIGSVLAGIPLMGFGPLYLLFNRNRRTFLTLVAMAIPALLGLILPLVQATSPDAPFIAATLTDARDPTLWYRIRLIVYNYRLLIFPDGSFIIHPRIFLQPIVIIPMLGLPLLLWLARKRVGAQMIAGTLIVEPLLLEVPPVLALMATRSTPWILHRLAWPATLVGVIALCWAAWAAQEWLARRIGAGRRNTSDVRQPAVRSRVTQWVPLLAVFVALIALSGPIRMGLAYLFELRADPDLSRCLYAAPVVSQLNDMVGSGTVVLSTPDLDLCVPMYAANAYPIEHYGTATINRFPGSRTQEGVDRVHDVNVFTASEAVDGTTLAILERWKAGLVLIRRTHPADVYFSHLSRQFTTLVRTDEYAIYRVGALDPADPIIAGNSAISAGKLDEAIASFNTALAQGTDAAVLAYLGLGRAYLAQGNLDRAVENFTAATAAAPDEPEPWALLGAAYGLKGEYAGAANAYRRSTALMPVNRGVWQALGDAARAQGELDVARAAYETSAGQRNTPGGSGYYMTLGSLYAAIGWNDDAAQALRQSLALKPGVVPYLALVQTYLNKGDFAGAQAIAEEAKRFEIWSDLPDFSLAQVYEAQGQTAAAIESHRAAVGLNPISTSYLSLVQDLNLVSGSQAALSEMQSLPGYRFGYAIPTLAVAQAQARVGDIQPAISSAERAWGLEPSNSQAAAFLGGLNMQLGQYDTAADYFHGATVANGSDSSPYIGMSTLDIRRGAFGNAVGWAWRGMLAAPYSSDVVTALGNAYAAQGDATDAVLSYSHAAQLDPRDPGPFLALGNLYTELGQSDKARAAFESAGSQALDQRVVSGMQSPPYSMGAPGSKFSPQARASYDVAAALQTQGNQALLYIGDLARDAGNLSDAIDAYQRAVQASPYSGAAYVALGNAYQQAGQAQAALDAYRQAIERDPGFVRGYLGLAQAYLLQAQNEAAAEVYRQALRQLPWRAEAILGLGQAQIRSGQTAEAQSSYEQALPHLDPLQDASLQAALADLAAKQGQYAEAEQWYRQAATADPTWLLSLGRMYEQQGDRDKAAAQYQDAVQQLPVERRADAYSALSSLALQQGRLNDSMAYAQDAISTLPTGLPGYASLASAYVVQGRFTEAAETYERALAILPGSVDGYVAQAEFLRSRGRWDDALVAYRQAQALAPGNAGPWLALGDAYRARADYAGATDAYQTAQQLDAGNVEAALGLGLVKQAQGRLDEAAADFRRAADLDKSQAGPWLNLGALDAQRLRLDEAANDYREAQARDPMNPATYIALGRLDMGRAAFTEAEDQFRQAIRVAPADGEAQEALGQALQAQGDVAGARAAYRQANSVDPGYVSAYNSLGLLEASQGNLEDARSAFQAAMAADASDPLGAIGLAQMQQMQGDAAAAGAQLEATVRQLPASGAAFVALGDFYRGQNRAADALAAYQSATQADPGYLPGYTQQGAMLTALGRIDDARAIYQRAADAQPGAAAGWIGLGDLERTHGDGTAAEEAYRRAVALEPGAVSAYTGLGQLLAQSGRQAEAGDTYQAAANNLPGSADALLARAAYLRSRGEWDQARAAYEQAQASAPGQAGPWLALGDAYRERADYDLATSAYQQARQLEPGNPQSSIGLGLVEQARGRYDEAEAQFREAADLDRSKSDAWLALGALAVQRNQLDDARRFYQEAIARAPADPTGYIALGQTWLSQAAFAQAEDLFQQAVAVAPASGAARQALGQVYGWQGDVTGAQAAYRMANEVEPRLVPAYISLGLSFENQGKLDDAEVAFRAATAADASDPLGAINLGRLLQLQGKADAAEAQYQAAIAAAPASGQARSALGDFYRTRNRPQEAIDAFQGAANADPGYLPALTGLAQVYRLRADTASAERTLSQAVDRFPARPDGYVELAQFYAARGRIGDAGKLLDTAQALMPGEGAILIAQGDIAAQQGQFDRARGLYLQVDRFDDPLDRAAPYLSSGDAYVQQGQWSKAAEAYQQAADLAPLDPTPLVQLGNLRLRFNRLSEAKTLFESAVARNPSSGEALTGLAQYYRQSGAYDQAEAQLRAAMQLDPTHGAAYAVAGDLYRAQGRFADAEDAYRHGMAAAPVDVVNYMQLGALLQDRGRMSEMRAALVQATDVAPASGWAWTTLAAADAAANRPDRAIADYRQAQAAEPTYDASYESLARLYMQQGKPGDAEKTINAGLGVSPLSGALEIALGDLKHYQGDAAGARRHYARAVSVQPGEADGYVAYAGFLMTQGEFDAALDQLKAGQAAVPRSGQIANALGDVYYNRGRFTDARAAYLQAIDLEPDLFLSAYDNLGDIAQLLGRTDDLIAGLQATAARHPGSGFPQLGLGNIYRQRGDLGNAAATYRRGIAVAPGNVLLHIALGEVVHLQGDWPSAQAEFQKAIDLQPGAPDAYLSLGSGWLIEDRPDLATSLYAQAAGLDHTDADPWLALGVLNESQNSLGTAESQYRQAVAADPLSIDARVWLAQVIARQGRTDEANGIYRAAADVDRSQALPLTLLGQLYLDGDPAYSTAETLFQRAISAQPGDVSGYLLLSTVYLSEGRLDDARAQIDQAKALAPGSGDPYATEVAYWAQQDKLDEANAAAERAVQLDPTLAPVSDFEAAVYRSWWQLPAKTDYYLALLDANPGQLWLHTILAAFYQQPNQDKPEYAVTHLEALVTAFPEDAEYHRELAVVYERLGRGNEAERQWQLYVSQALRDPARGVGLDRRHKLQQVWIDQPQVGAVLASSVEVFGSAYADNFVYYKLEFGIGPDPAEWSLIGDLHYAQVVSGKLGDWDTTSLPDGEYTLRVVVVDGTGNTLPAYRVTVTIKH